MFLVITIGYNHLHSFRKPAGQKGGTLTYIHNGVKVFLNSHLNCFIVTMAIRVVEFFQMGDTKLEIFLPNNQHIQKKLMNFEFWINGELSKSAKI